jgi:hypothetical protein
MRKAVMTKLSSPIIAITFVSMLVALPPSAFAQQKTGRQGVEPAPQRTENPRRAFYYRPGDLKGVPYDTIEECTKARLQAGDVGVCVIKRVETASPPG